MRRDARVITPDLCDEGPFDSSGFQPLYGNGRSVPGALPRAFTFHTFGVMKSWRCAVRRNSWWLERRRATHASEKGLRRMALNSTEQDESGGVGPMPLA